MLEKPDLSEQRIIAHLQAEYKLQVTRVIFLPLGADINTAVYRVDAQAGAVYFLKLRKGPFDVITVALPHFLKAQGICAIIPPLETSAGQSWATLDVYKTILYPFIDGVNGYEAALTERQWLDFGVALKSIHTVQAPPDLARRIPRETYPPDWRNLVRFFQAQVETTKFEDPVASRLAAFMRARQADIDHLVQRAEELGFALQSRQVEFVLCHADIHAGNLLLGRDESLYIVDWDNPIYAPKEHDLMHIGGSATWKDARAQESFYQGYGPTQIDRMALGYYRYERIVQDIAEFCKQLLLTSEGGEDREQSYGYFTGQFLPGHEVEIAYKTDE